VIRERLLAYEKQTRPLVDYYWNRGVLKVVDGAADIDEVGSRLNRIIQDVVERNDRV
jgi:adenylate kinase